MIENNPHTLQPNEVSQLIKDGVDLSDSGDHMYIMRFGWNNEFNKAADPKPFKIQPHLNKKLREDAMGMPYVVPPFGEGMHLRKRKGDKEPITIDEQLEAILKVQSDYAIGEIQGSLEYDTGNVWLIIDVWPEFQAGIERGYYPPLVSPTFNFIKEENGIVEDAQFLNLQGVPNSGYSPEYTQIESVCKNGINQCMAEMKLVGAAGELEQSRKDGKSFSISKNDSSPLMEETEIQSIVDKITPALDQKIEEAVVKPLAEVKAKVDEVVKMEEANADVLLEVATKTEGVDEKKVVTKEGEPKSDPPIPEVTAGPDTISGAAGQQILKELKEIRTKSNKFEQQAEDAEAKLKKAHIDSIIERKTRVTKLTEDEKTKLIESYSGMDITVLETLDNELKATIPEASKEGTGISGAYGLYGPETSTVDRSGRPKNSEMYQ